MKLWKSGLFLLALFAVAERGITVVGQVPCEFDCFEIERMGGRRFDRRAEFERPAISDSSSAAE